MKPFRNRFLLQSAVSLGLTLCASHATEYTWSGSTTGTWDVTNTNWATSDLDPWNATNGILNTATFNTASLAITASGTVHANAIKFTTAGSLSGGTVNLGGTTPTITANADASIGSILSGAAGLTKAGAGTLTLTGANTYTTGGTVFGAGTVTFSGSGGSTGGGTLALGTASGSRAVLNMNSSGTVTHNTTVNIGGAGASANGAGAINQTSGTVNLMNNTGYLQLGNGGYGSYVMSGGTLNFTNASGARIGDNTGGLGSFVQTGGTVNVNRYFVMGGNSGTAPEGVATLSGGSLIGPTGTYFILGNGGTAKGTMNVGTAAAGGNATVVSRNANGIVIADAGTPTGVLNINSGTIQFNAGMIWKKTAGGTGIVNLNGGTLKANAAGLTLINNTINSANVYNGGLKVDTQTNDATISANLLTTTGNGIYPAGGVINMPSAAGAGYIGAPLITVTTSGSGTGAGAIANVVNGQVTGVTLTCPGQGYAAGDTVTFAFAGGGSTSAASAFVYTLSAADLAANGAGGLTKLGTGKLTLTGANTFTGPVSVTGKLVSNNLDLNNTTLTINNFTPNASDAPVWANNNLTTGGTVQVQVNGTFTTGQWPLIYYPTSGSISGAGISALNLQTGNLPRGVAASLVDNASNFSVDLLVAADPLTWKGNDPINGSNWDIDTTTNWTMGSTAEKYLDGDIVLFDDSVGTGSTSVVMNSPVAPASVTFDNETKDYTLSGSGAITGSTGLTKNNTGTVTILNANTYTGPTLVESGTLRFGNGSLNGSITGPLVNHSNVVFNPAGTSAYAGAISGDPAGVFTKTGTGTQVYTGSANTSTGTFQINEGAYQIGNGVDSGTTGSSVYEIAAGATLRLEQATAAGPNWANIRGAGNLSLNSAQALNGSAQWGNSTLPATFTGTLRIEKGRVGANDQASLGAASTVQILDGGQLLAFTGTYTSPIEIVGNGYGENNRPGALRAAGSATVSYNGPITLTGNATIYAQDGLNTNFTVGGSINGPHAVEFNVGDNGNGTTVLNVAPIAAVQNSYTSTKINGSANSQGSVIAGNPYAFSSGPLEMVSAILKLNGNSLSFASLTGTGGQIGNYHATAPAVLSVGNSADTSYSGSIVDGGTAKLGLTKTGTGTLTLTGSLGYTGDTTVDAGTLSISSPSLSDAATVSITTGAKVNLPYVGSDTVGKLILGGTEVPAGTYDSSHVTYGSYFTGTGSIVIVGGFGSWATIEITDPNKRGRNDDADGDGFTNLQEFLFGKDPEATDGGLTTTDRTGNILTIRWKQRTSAVNYRLLENATLANPWNPSAAAVINDGPVSGDYQPKKAEVTIAPGRNFLRVEGTEQ